MMRLTVLFIFATVTASTGETGVIGQRLGRGRVAVSGHFHGLCRSAIAAVSISGDCPRAAQLLVSGRRSVAVSTNRR